MFEKNKALKFKVLSLIGVDVSGSEYDRIRFAYENKIDEETRSYIDTRSRSVAIEKIVGVVLSKEVLKYDSLECDENGDKIENENDISFKESYPEYDTVDETIIAEVKEMVTKMFGDHIDAITGKKSEETDNENPEDSGEGTEAKTEGDNSSEIDSTTTVSSEVDGNDTIKETEENAGTDEVLCNTPSTGDGEQGVTAGPTVTNTELESNNPSDDGSDGSVTETVIDDANAETTNVGEEADKIGTSSEDNFGDTYFDGVPQSDEESTDNVEDASGTVPTTEDSVQDDEVVDESVESDDENKTDSADTPHQGKSKSRKKK